jgi:O-antigen ligase
MEYFLLIASLVSVVAIFTVRWPVEAALGVCAFLLPFDTVLVAGQVGGIHLHVTWFAAAAACATLLLTGLMSGRGFVPPPRPALWWTLFVLWAISSSAWALNLETTTFRWPVLALLLILYLVTGSFHASEKELSRVAWMAILGGCAASGIVLYEFSRGQTWVPQNLQEALAAAATGSRATLMLGGLVTDPNILAASLILSLSLAVGRLLSSRNWMGRLVSVGAVALITSSIFATMSRGALVALCVVFLVFLWRSRASWRVLLPLAMMAAVIGGLVWAKPEVVANRLQATFEDRGAGRLDIWNAGLEAFRNHAILGVGLDGFPAAINNYRYVFVDAFPGPEGSHNIYIGTAVDLGVIGLALLLCAITDHFLMSARLFRSGTHGPARLRLISYEAACWGLLTCGFFVDLLWEMYFWLAWMLLVMALRAPTGEWIPNTALARYAYRFNASSRENFASSRV